jgi:hypothetical protein
MYRYNTDKAFKTAITKAINKKVKYQGLLEDKLKLDKEVKTLQEEYREFKLDYFNRF